MSRGWVCVDRTAFISATQLGKGSIKMSLGFRIWGARIWGAVCLALLVGCGGLPNVKVPALSGTQTRIVTLSDGLRVTAPAGYCAHPALTKAQSGLGFAAFAPCSPADQTFMTVAIRAHAAMDIADLPDPETAGDHVLKRGSNPNSKFAHLKNPELHLVQPVDQTFWRMVSHRNGYMALVNLYSAPGKSISQSHAEQIMGGLTWTASAAASDETQALVYMPMTRPWPKPKYRPY